MKIYKANERGKANYGWLNTNYSFSFADYYNPELIGYGALRVLNDDIIAPGQGFPNHPHENMEIITIVTSGELKHADSTGKFAVLTPGWVQVMSAGTGIVHSEFNNSITEQLELFQIWIKTKSEIQPKHEERKFEFNKGWNEVVSKKSLEINQDANISIGLFDKDELISLEPAKGKGIFLMVVKGKVKVNDEVLKRRDAISFEDEIELNILKETELLKIEV